MKVINSFIVVLNNKYQMLFQCETKYFITTDGALHQHDLALVPIGKKTAEILINEINQQS